MRQVSSQQSWARPLLYLVLQGLRIYWASDYMGPPHSASVPGSASGQDG